MSQSGDLLSEGLGILRDEFGQTFYVEGVAGSFNGLVAPTQEGTNVTVHGMIPSAVSTLTVSTDEGWTPRQGQRVTVDGTAWRCGRPERGVACWIVPLESPDA